MTITGSREAAFAELYRDTYSEVCRFLARRMAGDVADLAQETFTVAWRRLDAVPVRRNEARAWLFTVARNVLRNQRRAEGRRDELSIRIAAGAAVVGHDEPGALASDRADLAAAWQRLDPAEQEVIALTAFEQLSQAEAAQVLDISPGAYRVRLHRARLSLRRQLACNTPAPLTGTKE